MSRFRIHVLEAVLLVVVTAIMARAGIYFVTVGLDRTLTWGDEFSQDGGLIARASSNGLYVFSAETGKVLRQFHHLANCVTISRDNQLIAAGCLDFANPVIFLWESQTGKILQELHGHTDWISDVQFSPNRMYLISTGRDQSLKVWDCASGKLLRSLNAEGSVNSLALSPDGTYAAIGVNKPGKMSHEIQLWNIEEGRLGMTLKGPEHCYVEKLRFSPDGQLLASGLSVRGVRIWNVQTGQQGFFLEKAIGSNGLVFVRDTQKLLALDYMGASLWDINNNTVLHRFTTVQGPFGPNPALAGAYYDPSSGTIATSDREGNVLVWNEDNGNLITTIARGNDDNSWKKWAILSSFGLWVICWVFFASRHLKEDMSKYVFLIGSSFLIFDLFLLMTRLNGQESPLAVLSQHILVNGLVLLCLLIWPLCSARARMRWIFVVPGIFLPAAMLVVTVKMWIETVASV